MTTPQQPIGYPLAAAPAPMAPAPVPAPVAVPADAVQAVQAAPAPAAQFTPGALVRWVSSDPYDLVDPYRVVYGLVVDVNDVGAVVVVPLGGHVAHFGPAPTTAGPHGLTVVDLAPVGA